MQKTLSDLDKLQALISRRWDEYKQAIQDNKKFEDVKRIYLQIKELQKEANALMEKANKLHSRTSKK